MGWPADPQCGTAGRAAASSGRSTRACSRNLAGSFAVTAGLVFDGGSFAVGADGEVAVAAPNYEEGEYWLTAGVGTPATSAADSGV